MKRKPSTSKGANQSVTATTQKNPPQQPTLNKAKLETSITGNVFGYVQGFIKSKSSALQCNSPADLFSVEIDASPDSFNLVCPPVTLATMKPSVEVESILEWKKEFNYAITWSPVQVI
jgi:hypothetical protein